jgi:two-component system phosphate regulon sensor histidine kinase PhoR
MKYKWKLFFSYLLIVLIPFLVAERYLASHLRAQLLIQIENRLLKEALLIKTIIEKEGAKGELSYHIDDLVKKMGGDIKDRITFIDDTGRVLGDTDVPANEISNMEDHSRRPEFVAAQQGSHGVAIRYSTTLEKHMMYLAVRVVSDGDSLGVARVSVPLTQVEDLTRRTEYVLFTAFLLCAALILVFSIVASRRLSRPVEEMSRAAEEISRGNFDIKVYPGVQGELQALGKSINLMASEIQRKLREITQEKETLNTILRGMSDGVMVVDAQGRIILINNVLEELLERPPAVFGKMPVEVIRSAELQDGFAAALEEGKIFRMALTVGASDGDKVFDVIIARLMPEGRTEGAVAVFHDITDLKRIEKVRKDFVANVSHELRTPLTSIKGYSETICHEKFQDDTKIRSFAEIILKHANRLSALVEDLLSLTKLESEKSVANKRKINFRDVLDSSVPMVKPAAEEKHLTIETDTVPEVIEAWADRDQIAQALINLLDNAIKYTPEGGTVRVLTKDVDDELHVTVEDTGLGIPREDIDRIFERFYRVDKNRSRDMGGTGLGLSIVKHIIQGHGGKVWVRSMLDEGSAFSFSLPKKSPR